MSGYDSAQSLKEGDDLGRWRFAAEIAEVICSTPPDWSARIGIFGKWGEGKSTVLHFLEEMLKPEENIVFSFVPWAAQESDELWAEFGRSLWGALKAEGLAVEPSWKSWMRGLFRKSAVATSSDVIGVVAAVFGRGEAYDRASGLISKWLKPDGAQVRKIREKLGGKRVIVFVDDLDRVAPELLPKLLLSLREVLDLPGFTFVLAFDDEIVARGLTTTNAAWGDGESFLDKILDFHYHLPSVSKDGKLRLLKKMLHRYAEFVPKDSIEPVEHLLPENPRKLKQLVRSLVSLEPQLKRHDADELNWVEIWLAEMIRQESHSFFMRLLEPKVLDSIAGAVYKSNQYALEHQSGAGKKAESEVADGDIKKIIDEVGGINEVQADRLIELVKATRKLGGGRLEQDFTFAWHPEAVTWKEFCELSTQWEKTLQPETISNWIGNQSRSNGIGRIDVEKDLYQTLLNVKHNATERAAKAKTAPDNAKYCEGAKSWLDMIEQFLDLPGTLTPERFGALYEKLSDWVAFRMNPAEEKLRDEEQKLLLKLANGTSDEDAPKMLEPLGLVDPWGVPTLDEGTKRLKLKLRDKCAAALLPKEPLKIVEL